MTSLTLLRQFTRLGFLGLLLGAAVSRPLQAEEARASMKVRLGFGQRSPVVTTLSPRLLAGSPGLTVLAESPSLEVGGGRVGMMEAVVSWPKTQAPARQPHSIWQHLFAHGTPDQVARLKDDPALTPGAPLLTVQMTADGTRGFSIGLDQLARHQAMWLPEHDVFVTLGDAPVGFATHLASLRGERVLDRVKREPEATREAWLRQWSDFGDPTRPHHGQETEWLGTRGHLTGFVARHGSLYKFGVDRWAGVRPDHASPHRFRFDLLWPDCEWQGQRIVNGLPVLATVLGREGQRCEMEQFAAPLAAPAPSPAAGEPGAEGAPGGRVKRTAVKWQASSSRGFSSAAPDR